MLISRYWNHLTNLGIAPDMDPAERRAVGLVNRISVLSVLIFLSVSLIPAIFVAKSALDIFWDVLNISAFSSLLYLNYRKKYLWAKHFLMIYSLIPTTYVSLAYEPEGIAPLNYLGIVLIAPMIFRQKTWVYIYYGLTLASFIFSLYFHAHFPPINPIGNPEIVAVSRIINLFIGVFVIAFSLILFYRGLQGEYEAELMKNNQLLQEQHEQLKQTQSQLVQAEKMASLGQLTAGIAHEINNPLNFISANVEPLRKDLEELKAYFLSAEKMEVAEIEELFEEMELLMGGMKEGTTRTRTIVEGLRNFSRLDEEDKKVADIHQGLDSTLTLLQHRLKNRITVVKNFGEVAPLLCYPGKLNQVFMNLLTNAIDAISGTGSIFISTHEDKEVPQVQISIRDTGRGITTETLGRIFEPFYTTKEVGEGTGLGLAITYGIIQQHEGEIQVKSEVGKGTEFILILPHKQE